MRYVFNIVCLSLLLGLTVPAGAETNVPAATSSAVSAKSGTDNATASSPLLPGSSGGGPIEVTADQSLEWYQDQHLYVARGNAKAVRSNMTVEADVLVAHERDKPQAAPGTISAPQISAPQTKDKNSDQAGGGDIDKMTAEGNVHITTQKAHIYGQHGVYDLDQHVSTLTGNNLKYVTDEDTVTAKDSLEYWEDKKVAVARGDAVAIRADRHVLGDTLIAEFRDMPNKQSELWKMTAIGHVTVITKADVAHGDRAVYDINRNLAILTGHVHVTRSDGTQMDGDVAEADFATGRSRLMNEGHGRVRALMASQKTKNAPPANTQTGKGS